MNNDESHTLESHTLLIAIIVALVILVTVGALIGKHYSYSKYMINDKPGYVHHSYKYDNYDYDNDLTHVIVIKEKAIYGVASYYAHYFHGRLTANGEIYDMYDMTVAHRTLPFDTLLRVESLESGKSVHVRVNDRGPYIRGREIDLSLGVAMKLDMVYDGLHNVRIVVVGIGEVI